MTPQEAETVCHLLGELQAAICQEYGEEIAEVHRKIKRQQKEKNSRQEDPTPFNDKIPF